MSSFIGFCGKGFWCSESTAGLLAGLVVEHLRSVSKELWVTEYATVLDFEASSPAMGCMTFHMDEYLVDDHKKAVFAEAVLLTINELASSRFISMDRERRMPYAQHVTLMSPTPTDTVLRYAVITFLMLQRRWTGDEAFTLS